jgi:cytochrome c oxidase cbb3-type subunit III
MRFRKILLLVFALLFAGSSWVMGQATTAPVKEVQSTNNMLAIVLVIISLVFAFVIFGMGQVLLQLIRQVMEKNRQEKIVTTLLVIGLFCGNGLFAQDTATTEAVTVLPNYGGLNATAFWLLVAVIAIEVVAILFMLFFINRIQQELVPAKVKPAGIPFAERWAKLNNRFFTKAIPVEQEEDFLLDHDYDGIRELDNSLPPWWKWGFIITILFAGVYLLNFHVLGYGLDPTQEYEAEVKVAAAQLEAFNAKNKDKVDENNIVMADASGLADGKEIYTSVCWACHGKAGEGGAGPNLTDDYWLHKGSLNDIYTSIKIGYPDKGMQSWQKQYSPKQMSQLASYIKTLKGTNPANAKAAQGDLFTEATDTTVAVVAENAKK